MTVGYIVIGGKGTALCIGEQIVDAGRRCGAPVEFLGWAVDDPSLGESINGYPVLGRPADLLQRYERPGVKFIFSLFKPEAMRERVALLHSYNCPAERFGTFIHPAAYVAASAGLGHGSVVLANSTLNSNVEVGSFCLINSNVVIEHDSRLGSCVFVSAGAVVGSRVTIADGVFAGLNTSIRENTRVGAYAFLGAAANVVADVPPGELVYGNPARAR